MPGIFLPIKASLWTGIDITTPSKDVVGVSIGLPGGRLNRCFLQGKAKQKLRTTLQIVSGMARTTKTLKGNVTEAELRAALNACPTGSRYSTGCTHFSLS